MRIIVTIATLLVSGTIIAAQDADKIITNSIGMKLTLIPAGKFVMGSPTTENERDVEELPHEVTITKPFYLGVYEVTQKQYEKFMGKNPSFFKQAVADLPADQVLWVEAVEFCKRLSNSVDKKKGGPRLSPADGGGVGICLPGRDQNGLSCWQFAVIQACELRR